MKRQQTAGFRLASLLCGFCLAAAATTPAPAGEMKMEAQLIWGTNDEVSPDPDHKPVDAKVARKLAGLPIKWKYYHLVTRKEFKVAEKATTTVTMSKDCEIKVKNVDGNSVELQLVGKGKPIGKITQTLGKGKCLVTGGNAANFTSWFVFLKQIE